MQHFYLHHPSTVPGYTVHPDIDCVVKCWLWIDKMCKSGAASHRMLADHIRLTPGSLCEGGVASALGLHHTNGAVPLPLTSVRCWLLLWVAPRAVCLAIAVLRCDICALLAVYIDAAAGCGLLVRVVVGAEAREDGGPEGGSFSFSPTWMTLTLLPRLLLALLVLLP